MHGLIFETSIWLLAGSTRFVHNQNSINIWPSSIRCCSKLIKIGLRRTIQHLKCIAISMHKTCKRFQIVWIDDLNVWANKHILLKSHSKLDQVHQHNVRQSKISTESSTSNPGYGQHTIVNTTSSSLAQKCNRLHEAMFDVHFDYLAPSTRKSTALILDPKSQLRLDKFAAFALLQHLFEAKIDSKGHCLTQL